MTKKTRDHDCLVACARSPRLQILHSLSSLFDRQLQNSYGLAVSEFEQLQEQPANSLMSVPDPLCREHRVDRTRVWKMHDSTIGPHQLGSVIRHFSSSCFNRCYDLDILACLACGGNPTAR